MYVSLRYVTFELSNINIYILHVLNFTTASAMCITGVEGSKKYAGTISVTRGGRPCQRWDRQSPHKHTSNPADFPGKHAQANLYVCSQFSMNNL